jgi:hypothetical protein
MGSLEDNFALMKTSISVRFAVRIPQEINLIDKQAKLSLLPLALVRGVTEDCS